MPAPFIPVISALYAGGTLVPHAAGGLIVTSATGYVTGTYLSTAAITGLLASTTSAFGAGAIYITGATSSIIGSAGYFGTTVGASGLKGFLMGWGIISSTPLWVPIVTGGALAGSVLGIGYMGCQLYRLNQKLNDISEGEEAQLTFTEAKIIERLIRRLFKKYGQNED